MHHQTAAPDLTGASRSRGGGKKMTTYKDECAAAADRAGVRMIEPGFYSWAIPGMPHLKAHIRTGCRLPDKPGVWWSCIGFDPDHVGGHAYTGGGEYGAIRYALAALERQIAADSARHSGERAR